MESEMDNKKIVVINGKEYAVYDYTYKKGYKFDPDSDKYIKEKFYKERILSQLENCEIVYKEDINLLTMKTGDTNIRIGGDAIISLNTVAGFRLKIAGYKNPPSKLNEKIEKIKKSNIDKADIELFCYLSYLYHTKGNFMPLPIDTSNGKSLNQYKGGCPFFDFPDRFFEFLRLNFFPNQNDGSKNPNISQVKSEINTKYFKCFGTWEYFIEKNHLQPFYKDNFLTPKPLYCRRNNINEISEFLKTAVEIIERRNERIAETYK